MYHHFFMGGVQNRVHRAGLDVGFERPAYKAVPWLASKSLDLGRVSPLLTDETGTLCLSCLYTRRGSREIFAFFWGSGIWVPVRQKVPL